ncbi:MAG: hypothetical protein WCA79_02160 [Anaerolineales bacterium]
MAATLKRELDQDVDWKGFTQWATQARLQIQQTKLAALVPPNQKTKARYMNVESLVHWGQNLLAFFDTSQAIRPPIVDPELLKKKLGWLTDFRSQLKDWGELFSMITAIESFIRHHGLYRGVHLELEPHVLLLQAQAERTQRLRSELVAFVSQQEAMVPPGEHWLASSEIIESVFGKLKRLEQDQSKNGFTSLLLGLCALVSTTTDAVIQQALETVPTKQIGIWRWETLQQTVQSKRRQALTALKNAEQKWDQLLVAI